MMLAPPYSQPRNRLPRTSGQLSQLHGQRVRVQFWLNGEMRWLDGKGKYENDPALGGILSIPIAEPEGTFSVIISELDYHGQIEAGCGEDYDYCIMIGNEPMPA